MEIKINKDPRDFKESLAGGFTYRQVLCGAGAVGVAFLLNSWLKPALGGDLTGAVVFIGAAPIGMFGFVNYHGMTFERLVAAVWRSMIVGSGVRLWRSRNLWHELILAAQDANRKPREKKK